MALDDALSKFREASKEQLGAAWDIHVAKVEEQLRAGWKQQIESVIDERMQEVSSLIEQQSAHAARSVTERLNQTQRRLRQSENIEEWTAAVEEAAGCFCGGAAIYDTAKPEIADAPAVSTVMETEDTVVTLRARRELPQPVIDRFGEAPSSRCYLFPVFNGNRVAAVLYTQPGEQGLDRNGLELLAALAGAAIPRKAAQNLIMPAAQPVAVNRASILLDWSSLSADEQEMHLRAQRFARVRVAEMRLYDAEAVKRGRQDRNLYASLRQKIDAGRSEFRREFVEKCPSMTDYLHRELVRTLANDDESAMGQEYPGALA